MIIMAEDVLALVGRVVASGGTADTVVIHPSDEIRGNVALRLRVDGRCQPGRFYVVDSRQMPPGWEVA